jgi:hypothetical protein
MIAISAAFRSTDASTDAFSSFQYRKRNPAAQAALLRSIKAFGPRDHTRLLRSFSLGYNLSRHP